MAKFKVPYLAWRSGRPRWEPGPLLRARGFRGQDLKDERGNWLAEGAAIEAAKLLNAATKTSPGLSNEHPSPLEGEGVRRSCEAAKADGRGGRENRSTAALIARFLASRLYAKLAPNTKRSYLYHLKLIEAWAGDLPAAGLTLGAIGEFHQAIAARHGVATANALLRTLKRLLSFAQRHLEWVAINKASGFEMETIDGRLVLWSFAELAGFARAAVALDLQSQKDGVMLALMTGQRQADIVALKESAFDGTRIALRQKKTGTLVRVPAFQQTRALIAAIAERKERRWPKVTHTNLLVCEQTSKAYGEDGSNFRRLFACVRAEAAKICPSILEKRFSDLRDTAVTFLARAGCTIPEIATITGHSLATVATVLDKHYFVRDDALGDSAGAKLEAFLTKAGM